MGTNYGSQGPQPPWQGQPPQVQPWMQNQPPPQPLNEQPSPWIQQHLAQEQPHQQGYPSQQLYQQQQFYQQYQQPPMMPPVPQKWYRTNGGIIALLILFFPAGLYL